jgi:DNA-binding transcriptional ArsR family regulator
VGDSVGVVLAALADGRRRFLLETIARRGALTATELTGELPITRQAIAKHLLALRDAGLVAASRSGREARYQLTPEPLAGVVDWVARVESEWDRRLPALAAHLAAGKPPNG